MFHELDLTFTCRIQHCGLWNYQVASRCFRLRHLQLFPNILARKSLRQPGRARLPDTGPTKVHELAFDYCRAESTTGK